MTEELGFVHIERRRQKVDIYIRVKLRWHYKVLICFVALIQNSRARVCGLRELKFVRQCTNARSNGLRIFLGGNSNRHGVNFSAEELLRKHIFGSQPFIIRCCTIHLINNSSDQIDNAVPRKERGTKHIGRYGCFVKLLVIHYIESRLYIRNFLFENFSLGNIRVESKRFCKSYKDVLHNFTIFKDSLLKHSERIAEHLWGNDHSTDSVHKRRKEFVLQLRHVHDRRTDLANAFRIGCSDRNIILIINRRAVSDSVNYINAAIRKCFNLRFNCH